jgi:hypothetical protein
MDLATAMFVPVDGCPSGQCEIFAQSYVFQRPARISATANLGVKGLYKSDGQLHRSEGEGVVYLIQPIH